ncbi:MAG TPA: alpha-hydroxy acid oxidase [Streptosporangiaceae bacterium]
MRIGEIRELIQLKPAELNATRRRLAACHDIDDLRAAGRRLIPRPVFDYVDGAADEELAVRANRAAFRRWRLRPRLLTDVSAVDTTATVLDRTQPLPLALGPTGYTRMMHQAGEIAVARSAHRHGLAYTLSTMATTSIEDVSDAVTDTAALWFQLYVHRDEGLNKELVSRARTAGYGALMVTIDTVVSGRRIRDVRNGLVIPPALTANTLASIALRPGYWTRMLRGPALEFANLPNRHDPLTVAGSALKFDPSITWATIEALRAQWPGPLLLKGPLGPADAVRAIEAGVDGIILSNHGGRQLDRAIPPADLLPGVREAVGPDARIFVDSGIRHGADIAVAIALGADAALIGRAYLYGLMAGGEQGVDRALDLLSEQFTRTLQLLGVQSLAELRAAGHELLDRS